MPHPLVVHCLKEKFDIYIGRWNPKMPYKSIWHNPFKDGTKEENINRFIKYLENQPELLAQIHTLRGKKLGCWCSPSECHGDILATLANE